MAEISQEELNERVAILKRFRRLLEEQKKKFQDYLNILEKQESSIENDNTEAIVAHAQMEAEIAKSISGLNKVIVPMSKMYETTSQSIRTTDKKSVEEIQGDLERLQKKILAQNERNRELLRSHLVQLKKQIDGFKNPYRNISSIYAKKAAQGNLVAMEI